MFFIISEFQILYIINVNKVSRILNEFSNFEFYLKIVEKEFYPKRKQKITIFSSTSNFEFFVNFFKMEMKPSRIYHGIRI